MKRLVWIAVLAACTAPAALSSPSASPSATATPAASPTAIVTATPSPSPSASPAPTANDAARYGYIVASEGRIVVRGERATDSSLAIGGAAPAPSHDGKRIAFWRAGPQGNNPRELRIVDVLSGAERVVTTAPSGWNGGAIAWSNDDSGLLYEIDRIPDPNAPPGPPVAPPSRMFSIDLSTASAQPVTDPALDFDRGLVFIPLAWDTSAGIAAALTTGEGGFAAEYLVWDKRAGTVKKTPFPWPVLAGSVRPSADGTVMLANEFQRDGGLRFWGIRDIGSSQRLTPIPDTARSVDASWRTGTKGDFAWVTGFSVSLYTFATDRVPILIHRGQSDVAILAWRPDGSGIVLSEIGRGVFVVDLTTLQATALPHLGNPLLGGVLIR